MLTEKLTNPERHYMRGKFCYIVHGFSEGLETPEDLAGRPVSASLAGRLLESPPIGNFCTRGEWGVILKVDRDCDILSAFPAKNRRSLLCYKGHNALLAVPRGVSAVFYRSINIVAGKYARTHGLPLVRMPHPDRAHRHTLSDEYINKVIDDFVEVKADLKDVPATNRSTFKRYAALLKLESSISRRVAEGLLARIAKKNTAAATL